MIWFHENPNDSVFIGFRERERLELKTKLFSISNVILLIKTVDYET